MNATPMSHEAACVFRSKSSRPAQLHLVRVTEPCGCAIGRLGVPCDAHSWKAGGAFVVRKGGVEVEIRPFAHYVDCERGLHWTDEEQRIDPHQGHRPRRYEGISRGGWRKIE